MNKRALLLSALFLLGSATSVFATETYRSVISPQNSIVSPNYPLPPSPAGQPALVSFGLGWFDVSETKPSKPALDARAEYRWGLSLISAAAPSVRSWDRYFQIHPFAGLETSSRAQVFALGGLAGDIMVFENLILTPSLALGVYGKGNGKDLGNVMEFRPQAELAYQFANKTRTSAYYSYMSNWGLGDKNPSASTVGVYLHVPTTVMFGR